MLMLVSINIGLLINGIQLMFLDNPYKSYTFMVESCHTITSCVRAVV